MKLQTIRTTISINIEALNILREQLDERGYKATQDARANFGGRPETECAEALGQSREFLESLANCWVWQRRGVKGLSDVDVRSRNGRLAPETVFASEIEALLNAAHHVGLNVSAVVQ